MHADFILHTVRGRSTDSRFFISFKKWNIRQVWEVWIKQTGIVSKSFVIYLMSFYSATWTKVNQIDSWRSKNRTSTLNFYRKIHPTTFMFICAHFFRRVIHCERQSDKANALGKDNYAATNNQAWVTKDRNFFFSLVVSCGYTRVSVNIYECIYSAACLARSLFLPIVSRATPPRA